MKNVMLSKILLRVLDVIYVSYRKLNAMRLMLLLYLIFCLLFSILKLLLILHTSPYSLEEESDVCFILGNKAFHHDFA